MSADRDTGLQPDDYAEGRRRLGNLLAEMQLADFVYTIEPADGGWRVAVECAATNGWQRSEFSIEHDQLAACEENGETRLGVCAVGKIGARRSQFESDCPIV